MPYNMLIISPYVPYDSVPHAGGKTHNYYLKKFNNDINFNVKLITFSTEKEKNKIDLDNYLIDCDIIFYENKVIKKIPRILINSNSKFNPFNKNAGLVSGYMTQVIIKKLKKLRSNGYYPDVIVLEWTNIVLLINNIKKIFPNAKYVASEHDVAFLGYFRRYKQSEKYLEKFINRIKYKNIHSSELKALKQCDLVMPHNFKDMNLLLESGIDKSKLDYITPYFMDMSNYICNFNNKNIVFFGAMGRKENYEACVWFIENVFNNLLKETKEFKFIIIGGNPNQILKKYESENIIVTGFVEDIREYFENSLCMVVPLLNGAGIKVKVVESMSAGTVVLTNELGIEGIPAIDGRDYIHCTYPDDYYNKIIDIINQKINIQDISTNARKVIDREFNLEKSYGKYKDYIIKILK